MSHLLVSPDLHMAAAVRLYVFVIFYAYLTVVSVIFLLNIAMLFCTNRIELAGLLLSL